MRLTFGRNVGKSLKPSNELFAPESGNFRRTLLSTEVVVYLAESLLAAEIPLSRLNGCPKQKLNLLKLPAYQMA